MALILLILILMLVVIGWRVSTFFSINGEWIPGKAEESGFTGGSAGSWQVVSPVSLDPLQFSEGENSPMEGYTESHSRTSTTHPTGNNSSHREYSSQQSEHSSHPPKRSSAKYTRQPADGPVATDAIRAQPREHSSHPQAREPLDYRQMHEPWTKSSVMTSPVAVEPVSHPEIRR